MPTLEPDNCNNFFAGVKQLLKARGHHHELSVFKEAKPYIELYTTYSDWGKTFYGYRIILELPVVLYVHVNDRGQSAQVIQTVANEVLAQYEFDSIDEVSISVLTDVVENEEADHDKATRLQQMILATCTDLQYEGPDDYSDLRSYFSQSIRYKSLVPAILTTSTDLSQMKRLLITKFSEEKSRRNFIKNQFSEIMQVSQNVSRSPLDTRVLAAAQEPDDEYIYTTWQKAMMRRIDDPEAAITSARSLVESVCKHILEDNGVAAADNWELSKLYGETAKTLNLSPSGHEEQIFKQILSGCQSIINGLASLRNALGDAHGKSRSAGRPASRHAELAVNVAGSLCLFLIQTNKKKNVSKNAIH